MGKHSEWKRNYRAALSCILGPKPTNQQTKQKTLHLPSALEGTTSIVYSVCYPSPKFPNQVPLPLENYCA